MASLNKVQLIGNLGRDPEMRSFPSGDQVASVTIATTEKWKDKQTGEAKEHTEWTRVQFGGKLAEIVGQYLRKGSQVYVEGSLKTRKYNDKDGVEKYVTEIRADKMLMLGGKLDSAPAERAAKPAAKDPAQTPSPKASGFDDMDDDIPF